MALTEFGALVRKARIDARIKSLGQMADELGVTPSLLSGMETGRRKVSETWIQRISEYFKGKGVDLEGLEAAADLSNRCISLEGLPPEHQVLLAGFARAANVNQDTIIKFRELLKQVQEGEGVSVRKRSK